MDGCDDVVHYSLLRNCLGSTYCCGHFPVNLFLVHPHKKSARPWRFTALAPDNYFCFVKNPFPHSATRNVAVQ